MSTRSILQHVFLGVFLGLFVAPLGVLVIQGPALGYEFCARGVLAYITVVQYAVAALVLYYKGIDDDGDDVVSNIIFLATLGLNSFLTITFASTALMDFQMPLVDLCGLFMLFILLTQCTLLFYMAVSRVFDFFNLLSSAAGRHVRARFVQSPRQSLPQRIQRTSKYDLSLLAHLEDDPESVDVEIVEDEDLKTARELSPLSIKVTAEKASSEPPPHFKSGVQEVTRESPRNNLPAVAS